MTVDVMDRLWDAWTAKDTNDLQLVFRCPAPHAFAAVRAGVAATEASVGCIAPVPGGVGLMAAGGEELALLLDPLARHLAEGGISGTFDVDAKTADDYPPWRPVPEGYLLARAALLGERAPGNTWSIAAADRASVVREALSWAAAAGPLRVVSRLVAWKATDPSEAAELADAFLAANDQGDVYAMAGAGEQWRHVHVAPWYGHVAFGLGARFSPAALDELAGPLRRIASSITYAYARCAKHPSLMMAQWHQATAWPRRSTSQWIVPPDAATVEESAAAEAFGLQFVTGDTGAVPRERWTVEPVGGGALVIARQPDPWFTTDAVPEDVRTLARADLLRP